jgi:N-acetylglucosamine kinase-like BadF-type ATPase
LKVPGERTVLGLDGGASHTVCVIVNEAGQVLSRAVAGPCNHQSISLPAARAALAEAVGSARQEAGNPGLEAACLGMAGLDRDADLLLIQEMIAPLFEGVPVVIVHDADIALAAGTGGRRFGVAVIAGTGSIALGYNAAGKRVRAGGWGHFLGDEGSGYDIARRGLNAAARAWDGRGPATGLVERLLAVSGDRSLEELADRIYLDGWTVGQAAALAPVVLEAAEAGDRVALEIVAHAARELALMARVVIEALGLQDEEFPVVLSGGIFASRQIFEPVRQGVNEIAPLAEVARPAHEPAYGAALLALQR